MVKNKCSSSLFPSSSLRGSQTSFWRYSVHYTTMHAYVAYLVLRVRLCISVWVSKCWLISWLKKIIIRVSESTHFRNVVSAVSVFRLGSMPASFGPQNDKWYPPPTLTSIVPICVLERRGTVCTHFPMHPLETWPNVPCLHPTPPRSVSSSGPFHISSESHLHFLCVMVSLSYFTFSFRWVVFFGSFLRKVCSRNKL